MTGRKKILIFIDWFLPGYKAGGPIRSCVNLIGHLKDEFDFLVVTRDTDYCEHIPYPGIKQDTWNALEDGTLVYYISASRLTAKNIKKIIRETDFDVAYLNGLYSYFFTLLPLFYLPKKKVKVIVAVRGMLAPGALSVKGWKKKVFIALAKVVRLFRNIVFHATSSEEADQIRQTFGTGAKIGMAPNLPKPLVSLTFSERIKEKGAVKLVNIARISPEKNLKYALEVLSRIKEGRVEMDIYGPVYNGTYCKECTEVIRRLPPHVTIRYHGSIASSEIHGRLKAYHFMLMPTLGENFGHIIMEALLSGCPPIISDRTPWNEIGKKNAGWTLPLQEPRRYAKVIEECIAMDQSAYTAVSENAFEFGASSVNNAEAIWLNKNLFF